MEEKNENLNQINASPLEQLKISQEKQISNYSLPVNKRIFNRLELFKCQIDNLLKHLKSKRYTGKKALDKRLLGEILATHPSISFVNASEVIMISRAQELAEAGIICDENALTFDDIALSSPSEAYLHGILDETATDILFLMYYRIFYEDKIGEMTPSLFLSCDKATSGGFVKVVSWYSPRSKRVEQQILDVDKSNGESRDCAKAM